MRISLISRGTSGGPAALHRRPCWGCFPYLHPRSARFFDFARNADLLQIAQEFAGATWSPDHRTLFANIQSGSGYSIAIWGPWMSGPFG